MSKVKVIDDVRSEVTREATRDEWDGDDICEHHSISGIELVPDNGRYRDLEVSFKVEEGETYYLVAVYYDTGDSFHREENRVSFIDLFKTYSKAKEAKKVIDEHSGGDDGVDTGSGKWTFGYKNEAGSDVEGHADWVGYFEHFRECVVHPVMCH